MAKLSEALIANLTRPSFGDGLFQAGSAVGNLPLAYRQGQERTKQTQALQSMLLQASQGPLEERDKLLKSIMATSAQTGVDATPAINALNLRTQEAEARQDKLKQNALRAIQQIARGEKDPVKARADANAVANKFNIDYETAEQAFQNGLPTPENSRERYMVTPKGDVFDTMQGSFVDLPKEEVENLLSVGDAIKLSDRFTLESIENARDSGKGGAIDISKLRRLTPPEGSSAEAPPLNPTAFLEQSRHLNSLIDQAMEEVGDSSVWGTGTPGQFLRSLESSDAGEIDAVYSIIKNNEFIRNLSDLKREAGGIGAISNAEGERFESLVASLKTGRNKEKQIEDLVYLKEYVDRAEALISGNPTDFYFPNPDNPDQSLYFGIDGTRFLIDNKTGNFQRID